jgi:hypothetical protein
MHDARASFRAREAFVSSLSKRARLTGFSLSEYLQACVIRWQGADASYRPKRSDRSRGAVMPGDARLGMEVSAMTLAEDVAGLLGVPSKAAWDALCILPENMLGLLDSLQGWTALASFIACDLRMDAPEYRPRVH